MSLSKICGACLLLVIMLGGSFGWAAEVHKPLQLLTQIRPRASLSLERTQISFAGPEDQGLIPSQERTE